MTRQMWTIAGVSLLALALTACGEKAAETPAAPTEAAAPAAPPPPDFAAIIASPDRMPADTARDSARKPADVLAFSKIGTGNTVFEMEAGGGYYTELISRAVGPTGQVIMQGPKEFEQFYKGDMDAHLANNRLANVRVSQSAFDTLDAPDASVDVVTWFQGPHEMYCKAACGNAPLGETAKAFQEISRILKPGGYLVIMDHAATQGSPDTTGNDLHRIDPMIVKASATAAGFTLDEESSILANPSDDHTKGVFDDSIRGKTDQFLLRYKKPG
ncbi:MAG TPA: methyltransferase domain-containing protein [Hyphomonadaceae bacterium]|nr:methyltransferase domain-containing protein [Hyphomonadaceae bacterium]